MALRVFYVEATDRMTGKKFYIECDNEKLLEKFGLVGSTTAVALPNDTMYVIRKMTEEEFNLKVGEKWPTEPMQYWREYHNASVKVLEAVAELSVDKNKHMVSISKIDPHSYVNKNSVFRWVRRNKVQACAAAIGIAIDVPYVTVSLIDDKVIGVKIGAAIGTILPVWGNIIIGFIGGLIGALIGGGIVQLARYMFCVAHASPGAGVPILDTDPYPTYTGIPDQGLDDNVYGLHGEKYDTEAFGLPSMGLDTNAFGTPESEYRTRRM